MQIWRIAPLPDFLADHTLTGEGHADKLREVSSRWVQWVANLWSWHDRASFAMRYVAAAGEARIYLLAQAHVPSDEEVLAGEVGVLLRTQRLGDGQPVSKHDRKEIEASWTLPDPAILEIRQYETRSLWRLRESLINSENFRHQFGWLSSEDLEQPRVIYPWCGPGGPFLLPMESLISQPAPVTLTIFIEPTKLQQHEWRWLAAMASEAQSQGDHNLHQLGAGASLRVVNPSASLAGRLYIANLERLSASPFLVTIHAAAGNGRYDIAGSIAGAMQSLVQERPYDRSDQAELTLPSGALVVRAADGDGGDYQREMIAYQQAHLRFAKPHQDDPLVRLPYLVDARGAATVFRLPVSVRGGVPGIQVRQLVPDFHPGPREMQCPPEHLCLGSYQAGGRAYVPVRDLCKHVLITGFTGSGKTVTVLQLLHQLWVDHKVPFLVLESAKQEYRGLLGVEEFSEDLQVFTLGNELCSPLRLNPFQLLPGVRVEAHLSKLQTCFEGAIPPVGPSSSVISEALLRVYEEKGWSLTDIYPLHGESRRRFPRMVDFVRMVEVVLNLRGYEGEVQSNLKAALVGRITPLLIGGKGRMFDTERSHPSPNDLFRRPTVIEMNDLNVDDKALSAMFLLTMLREYRERNRSSDGNLVHVTMVEEAHNLLENVSSKGGGEGATSADTRFKAVEAFCQMLTEIRSLGEGLVIADQSPEKLARDAMRNTNLQIAHQLRDGDDRKAIANAMIMEQEQCDFLGKLLPGQAALFRTGLEKATFICVDKYYPNQADTLPTDELRTKDGRQRYKSRFRGFGFDPLLSDDELSRRMEQHGHKLDAEQPSLPFAGCEFCQRQCEFRDPVFAEVETETMRRQAEEWHDRLDQDESATPEELWQQVDQIIGSAAIRSGLSHDNDAFWCFLLHIWALRYGPYGSALDEGHYLRCLSRRDAVTYLMPDADEPGHALSSVE